jgi:hypothetical protein
MLQTVAVISEAERLKGSPKRNYHFMVNGIAKGALARNFVVWMLLERVAMTVDADERELVLNTVFFVYLSTMMPRYAVEMLDETTSKVIGALEKGGRPLKWGFLHEKDIPSHIAALKHWFEEGKEILTSSEIIDKVSMKMWGTSLMNAGTIYKNEKSLYLEAAVLFPSKKVHELHDPEFLALIERYSRKPKNHEAIQAFKAHLKEH